MTLTLLLLILLPLFVIPGFLLSRNRLRFFLLCSLPTFILILTLNFIDLSFPAQQINERIGRAFMPMWYWLIKGYTELNQAELIHLSASFSYLLLYFIFYIVFYIPAKIFYIGSNPNIHHFIRTISRTFDALLFILSTYGIVFLFLIEIREILPFDDGFLSSVFDWIYKIEV